jgi:hypothetical protein
VSAAKAGAAASAIQPNSAPGITPEQARHENDIHRAILLSFLKGCSGAGTEP